MTTDKITFAERRAALEVAGTRLRNAITELQTACDAVDAEANAMRLAETRFRERSSSRRDKSRGHG